MISLIIGLIGYLIGAVFLIFWIVRTIKKHSWKAPRFCGSIPHVLHGELPPLMNEFPGPSDNEKGVVASVERRGKTQGGPGISSND